MFTSQPNSHDQQSIKTLQNTSMVDAFHEKTIAKANKFKAKNVQPNSASDPNEVQPNSKTILVTQPMSASITTNRQANEVVQSNLVGMFIKYGAPRFVHEGGIDPTQLGDVEYGSLPTLD